MRKTILILQPKVVTFLLIKTINTRRTLKEETVADLDVSFENTVH